MRSALTILLIALLTAGCGGPRAESGAGAADRHGIGAPAEIGLEARVWRVDAVGGPLLHALSPHALAGETKPDLERERWREAGLRLVLIPASLAESLEAGLPHANAVHRLSLGQPTRWTSLAASNVRDGTTLRVPGGARRLSRGRLELLTRAWAEPAIHADRSFRVELAVGWSPALIGPDRGSDRREALTGLVYSVSIPDGLALVVLPAMPEENWTTAIDTEPAPTGDAGPEPPTDAGRPETGLAPLPAPRSSPGAGSGAADAGPALPEADSVGESLLITPAVLGERPVPARRDVFVLIPRWP